MNALSKLGIDVKKIDPYLNLNANALAGANIDNLGLFADAEFDPYL